MAYQKENPSKKIGDCLYELNVCDPAKLIKAIGNITGEKGVVLTRNIIKINITDYLSLDALKKNRAIPFEIDNGKIKVCFPSTNNKRNMETIRLLCINKGLVMEPYITFEKEIDLMLKSLEGTGSGEISSEGVTIVNVVDSILKTGMEKRASDIHIEPMEDEVRVRYRIDGELYTVARLEKSKQAQLTNRLKAISNMHLEKQESQDGRILAYPDYNIRSSSQPNVYGEKFVLRLLKKNANIKSIFDLGFMEQKKNLIRVLIKRIV